jgi:hypothetical protein
MRDLFLLAVATSVTLVPETLAAQEQVLPREARNAEGSSVQAASRASTRVHQFDLFVGDHP